MKLRRALADADAALKHHLTSESERASAEPSPRASDFAESSGNLAPAPPSLFFACVPCK
jgi:hypothetical protein